MPKAHDMEWPTSLELPLDTSHHCLSKKPIPTNLELISWENQALFCNFQNSKKGNSSLLRLFPHCYYWSQCELKIFCQAWNFINPKTDLINVILKTKIMMFHRTLTSLFSVWTSLIPPFLWIARNLLHTDWHDRANHIGQ